ncbi:MAG: hypothetical protein FWF70_05545 [Bacteroidetes bacterium]|nr:hypothetical protein [Bacteroidota bacterium]MCL1968177.1 hypothetical protein [Bacteroidota bacterium]MCL1968544.1 hypothetical protein [Bacteroidota bacterium]
MKNNYLILFLFVLLILNCSCPTPDITPAFLIVSAEDFTVDVSDYNDTHDQNYGAKELDAIKQHKFSDVLVSLNGKELGYWRLPCTIPLLPDYSGRNNIKVIPCVRTVNMTETTLQYSFLTKDPTLPGYGFEQFFERMEKEGEYRFSDIRLKYLNSVDFPILETFSQSTDFKPRNPDTFPASIEIVPDEELGKDIGRIELKDSAIFFDIVSSYVPLLGKGERQFWEISYKSINGQMITHLDFENSITMDTHDMVGLPSTKGVWKKVYIDISNTVMQASYIAPQVSTCLRITGTRDTASMPSYYYFENIKLITAPY